MHKTFQATLTRIKEDQFVLSGQYYKICVKVTAERFYETVVPVEY